MFKFAKKRTQIKFQNQNRPNSTNEQTAVMMVGEMEFMDLFLHEKEDVPYETFSLSLFFIFVIVMTIIVMNLLVGLAVDDIKAVQDTANLKRLAMLVTLSLDVEMLLPEFIRRKIIIRDAFMSRVSQI